MPPGVVAGVGARAAMACCLGGARGEVGLALGPRRLAGLKVEGLKVNPVEDWAAGAACCCFSPAIAPDCWGACPGICMGPVGAALVAAGEGSGTAGAGVRVSC